MSTSNRWLARRRLASALTLGAGLAGAICPAVSQAGEARFSAWGALKRSYAVLYKSTCYEASASGNNEIDLSFGPAASQFDYFNVDIGLRQKNLSGRFNLATTKIAYLVIWTYVPRPRSQQLQWEAGYEWPGGGRTTATDMGGSGELRIASNHRSGSLSATLRPVPGNNSAPYHQPEHIHATWKCDTLSSR